jgi:hypothetical protein
MPSLDQLPVELIDQFAGCLCHDCTPGHPKIQAARGIVGERDKRLRTSTVIRAINKGDSTQVGLHLHSWGKSEVLDMMTSLCPNVREVAAEINSTEILTRNAPGSLTGLRHVSFKHRSSRDRERMGLNLLGCIATVAPGITTLAYDTVEQGTEGMMTLPIFAHLVDLRLEDAAIGLEPLRKLLAACPNLRSFSYRAGGRNSVFSDYRLEQFTPLEAQQTVVRLAPNLTSLALDMSGSNVNGPPWGIDMIRSLAELSRLERLTLDFNCLVPEIDEWGGGNDPASYQDPMLLVRLLPSSIRSLSLFWIRRHFSFSSFTFERLHRIHIQFMQLASATRDQFPKLETVTAAGLGLNWGPQDGVEEEVKAAFEARGIIARFD